MAMKLLDVYKSMMQTAGLFVTEDHLVSCHLTDEIVAPVMLKGKRLALPSPAILARPDKSDITVFHPLNESFRPGESEVLEKYRRLLMVRFNEVAGTIGLKLLNISASIADHPSLSPDQAEFLTKVKGVDDKTIEVFEKVLEAMPADQVAKRILTLFLKKTGSVAGKRYKRVGVVSFPLYDELQKKPTVTIKPPAKKGDKETKVTVYDIYGVKCREKDRDAILALMEYIFPNIQEVGSYNRGSDSDIAANLDALMQASLAVIQALNSITETFENVFNKNEDASSLLIDCEWHEAFMNLGAMLNEIRMVPMQAGNEGSTEEDNKPQLQGQQQGAPAAFPADRQMPVSAAVVPASNPHAAPHAVVSAPVATALVAPAPQTQKSGVPTGEPLDSFLAQREAERIQRQQLERGWVAVTHQNQAPVQPPQQPYYPAAPFAAQPQGPIYQAPPVQPVHTRRGLDFGSVLAGNPAMAMATGGPVYGGGYPPAPMQQTSSFFANWNAPQPQAGYYQQQQPQGYQAPPQGYYQPQGYQRMI